MSDSHVIIPSQAARKPQKEKQVSKCKIKGCDGKAVKKILRHGGKILKFSCKCEWESFLQNEALMEPRKRKAVTADKD